MRDPAKLDPEIRAYLEAENKHTTAWSNDMLIFGITCWLKCGDVSKRMRVPCLRETGTMNMPRDTSPVDSIRYSRAGIQPELETVLLHGDKEAEGQSFFRIGGCTHSTDHKMLAYAVDLNGSERYDVKIRDLESGHNLADSIPDASGSMAWAADGETYSTPY